MEGITNFAEFLNWTGRPLAVACPCCGRTISEEEIKSIIKSEDTNLEGKFLPFNCPNCDKELSVTELITV